MILFKISDFSCPCEAVLIAVWDLLHDTSCYKTPQTTEMIHVAHTFTTIAKRPYETLFVDFASSLMADIQSCFKKLRSELAEREYICTKFHSLRTSLAFHNSWGTFLLKFIHENPGPIYILSTSNPKHLKTSTESYLSVKKCLCYLYQRRHIRCI